MQNNTFTAVISTMFMPRAEWFFHLKRSKNNAFRVPHVMPVTLHCGFYRKFSYKGDGRFESLVDWVCEYV